MNSPVNIFFAAPELMALLKGIAKHNDPDSEQLLALVKGIDAGFNCTACVGRNRSKWNLRFTVAHSGGWNDFNFIIPDEETAKQIKAHIEGARERRKATRFKEKVEALMNALGQQRTRQ